MRGFPRRHARRAGRVRAILKSGSAAPATWSLLALLALGSGCSTLESLPGIRPKAGPPILHDGQPLTIITTRFDRDPPSLYSPRARHVINFHFDPQLVQLAEVDSFSLWTQDREGGDWQRIHTTRRLSGPMEVTFPADGAYGLRASAVYRDGREVCVPSRHDTPLMWLYVDRQPPQLYWISPEQEQYLLRQREVTVRWGVSEMQFGDQEIILSHSIDGGRTWLAIATMRGRSGEHFAIWDTPRFSPEKILLRVKARDLAGNEAEIQRRVSLGVHERNEAESPVVPPIPPSELVERPSPEGTRVSENPAPDPGVEGSQVEPASFRGDPPGLIGPPTPASSDPVDVEKRSSPAVRQHRLVLMNLQDGRPLPGGIARYLFFRHEGPSADSVRVQARFFSDASEGEGQLVAGAVPARLGKILWTLPARSVSGGRLRLEALDRDGRRLATSEPTPVSIDAEPPEVLIEGFPRGADGRPGVRLRARDRGPAGLEKVILHVTRDGGKTWRARPVEDPATVIPLVPDTVTLGFEVQAIDRVGHDTGAPAPGAKPRWTLKPSREGMLQIQDLSRPVFRGGTEVTCAWTHRGDLAGEILSIDISPNGVGDWRPLAEAPVGAGRKLVILPARESESWVLRLRLRLDDGTFLTSQTRRFAIDASAPQIALGPPPGVTGGELVVPARITDPGAAGLQRVVAHVRPHGATTWSRLPDDAVRITEGEVTLAVDALDEGRWEGFLRAFDAVGNASPGPGSEPRSSFEFRLDRTAPRLRVRETAFPWVEGFEASVEIDLDREDVVPPLVLEGRVPGESWQTLHRWASLPPGQDLYRFRVPRVRGPYTLRLTARDRVGNVSRARLGPRTIEPALELPGLEEGRELRAGETLQVRWRLHPALGELSDQLTVSLSHRPVEAADWVVICDDLAPGAACAWSAPAGPGGDYLLQARLFLRGEIIAEAVTPEPLRVLPASSTAPAVTPGADPGARAPATRSQRLAAELVDRAEIQLSRLLGQIDAFRRLEAQLASLDEVPEESQREFLQSQRLLATNLAQVKKNYRDAYQNDPESARACYGLARLERALNPRNPELALPWLQRTVGLDPTHVAALNDLGASYIQQGNHAEAERVLLKAYRLVYEKNEAEKHPGLLFNYGQALFFRGKYAMARRFFEALMVQGAEGIPRSRLCYYFVATFVEAGEREQGLVQLERYESYMSEAHARALREALES